MSVYDEIASRYGVDPGDADAVNAFFETGVYQLPQNDQEAIALEILERDGEPEADPDRAVVIIPEHVPFPNPDDYVRADSPQSLPWTQRVLYKLWRWFHR